MAQSGIPGWCSGLAPAFGPGRDPGDLGSSPMSDSRRMEPASPSAYVSASLSHCVPIINKKRKEKKNIHCVSAINKPTLQIRNIAINTNRLDLDGTL